MHFASSMIDSTGCLLVWRHWKEIDAVKAQSTDQIMLTWTMISGAILFFSPRRSKATSPNRAKTNFERISTGTLWISFPNSRPKALMSLMERVSDKNHKTTNKGFLKFHIPRVISGRLGKGPPNALTFRLSRPCLKQWVVIAGRPRLECNWRVKIQCHYHLRMAPENGNLSL